MKINRLVGSVPTLFLAILGLLVSNASLADIRIGVILSLTGAGASVGIPEQNAIKQWPAEMLGQKLVVTFINDGSDPSTASRSASRLANEDKVDVIVGPSLTPTSLSMVQVAAEARVPMVSLAAGGAIVDPVDDRKRWAFKLGAPEKFSSDLVADDVKRRKGSTIGVIALASAFGDGFLKAMENSASARGLRITGVERFNATDQSVTSQVVKLMQLNPDAIYVAAAGTPGTLPQIELTSRGYKGRIYQTSAVANSDFLRVAGKAAEGMHITVLPLMVAEQLKESDPLRGPSMDFVRLYEKQYGANSRSGFGASSYDAYRLIESAAKSALTRSQPGTEAFRSALRDGLEQIRDLSNTTLPFNFSANDHAGLDQRCQVLAVVRDGKWVLAE